MPDDATILGFSNRWYALGLKTATDYALNDEIKIRILTPPVFIATKFEAFLGRGKGDLLESRDIEDILYFTVMTLQCASSNCVATISMSGAIGSQCR